MIDPKMLELSVYQDIPHLLTPGRDRPDQSGRRAEMGRPRNGRPLPRYEPNGGPQYRRLQRALKRSPNKGRKLTPHACKPASDTKANPSFEDQPSADGCRCRIIVVVVDEMADLMLVAGKDVEAAIQRLAQMARAAGIHLMMATQRPSVDVITGTIKANFPTRISFQVTSKIDSRTILGEQGAEQLLGQGDMLYMAGGGRISRVHGPFVSDEEVERVVGHSQSPRHSLTTGIDHRRSPASRSSAKRRRRRQRKHDAL